MNFLKKCLASCVLTTQILKSPHSNQHIIAHLRYFSNRNSATLCLATNLNECTNQLKIIHRNFHSKINGNRNAVTSSSALQIKKRLLRKKRSEDEQIEGKFNVFAYATAEEYDLEALHTSLTKQDLYETRKFFTGSDQDVLYVRAKYLIEPEPRDIFFFREGSVVLWNCTELETSNVIQSLAQFEINSYDVDDIMNEKEIMNYNYANDGQRGYLKNGDFYIQRNGDGELEKYTFSNAMTSSVKLGIWEAVLDKFIDGIAFVTEDLKDGQKIRMTRAACLRKTGELFALKHLINLNSDLLETPDFYWDLESLENLFLNTCSYFSVQRRKKIINEKLNHCIELTDLVSSNLNDAHHIRLEWMIIVLIMVEVGFEIVHYIDRFVASKEE